MVCYKHSRVYLLTQIGLESKYPNTVPRCGLRRGQRAFLTTRVQILLMPKVVVVMRSCTMPIFKTITSTQNVAF